MSQVSATNFNLSGTPEQIAQFNLSMVYLQSSVNYSASINNSVERETVRNIVLTDQWVTATYNATTKTITWNPSMSMVVKSGDVIGAQSPAVQLGHEFAHGGDATFDKSTPAKREATALSVEKAGNNELKEPNRGTYDDVLDFVHTNNSTEHTTIHQGDSVWAAMWQDGNMYYGSPYGGGVPSVSPIVAWAIEAYKNQICIGYWDLTYSPSQVDSNGAPLPTMTWRGDPVILNLSGGAVHTQGGKDSTAHFDMQDNGQQIHTGWATAGEGLLVIDHGAGTVSSAKDLVGSIEALESFDSNHDGVVTSADTDWAKLKVWVDHAGHGQFAQQNLHTLEDLGIAKLNLAITVVNQEDHGNTIKDIGTFIYADGQTGQMASVELVGFPPASMT